MQKNRFFGIWNTVGGLQRGPGTRISRIARSCLIYNSNTPKHVEILVNLLADIVQ